jgi:hypothetical protein
VLADDGGGRPGKKLTAVEPVTVRLGLKFQSLIIVRLSPIKDREDEDDHGMENPASSLLIVVATCGI